MAARAQPAAAATCVLAERAVGRRRRLAGGWNFGPRDARRAPGRAGSSSGCDALWGERRCAGSTTRGAHPHEAHVPAGSTPPGPARGSAGRRAGTSTQALDGDRRVVRGAARRRGHARASRCAQIDAFEATALSAVHRRSTLPLLRRAARGARFADLGMSPLANSYLTRRAARTRWSRSIRCTRSSATQCFLVQLEEFESPGARSSPTTPTSRRTRRRWLEHCRALRRRR